MRKEEIIEAVNKTFEDVLEIPPEQLLPEAKIFEDLGLDSLDMVDLMIGLQRKFGISLRQNEEIRKIVTLGDIYVFFEKMESDLKEQGVNTDGAVKDLLSGDGKER